MRFQVTQEQIDKFNKHGSYWFTRVDDRMSFSSGASDPICAAVEQGTGRGVKFDYWPRPQVGVMTKCHGGYYMFDLPQAVLDVCERDNGALVLTTSVEFELPIEEEFEAEKQREAQREAQNFSFAI